MNSSPKQPRHANEPRKRGRLLLMAVFWILAGVVCFNVRVLAARNDLPPIWTQVEFFGCMLLIYPLMWTGLGWARRLGVIVFVFWAAVFLRPAIITGPYLAPLIHFAMAGLLLFLALALSFSEDVVSFLDSKRPPEGRGFDASEITPAVHRIRQDYLAAPRVGSKGARVRRMLLAVARRTIAGLKFFRRMQALGTGKSEAGTHKV